MSNFFVESFVGNTPTHYYSGWNCVRLLVTKRDVAEVGSLGRTLLNAFNALNMENSSVVMDLVTNAYKILDSYLQNGFSETGFFNWHQYPGCLRSDCCISFHSAGSE